MVLGDFLLRSGDREKFSKSGVSRRNRESGQVWSSISLTHPPLGHGEMALSNRQILYFTRGKAEKAIYCYSKKAQIR